MPELIQLNSGRKVTRIFLILVLLTAAFWCYFVLRWYLGNTLAEYFDTNENSLAMAQLAKSLAPNDPLAHWRLGQVYQQKLTPDKSSLIIAEFEKAVSLSPNDYRFWMALGTAQEQAGNTAQAEQSLRQAIVLAPSYALPRWYLGNLLLRNARYDEAFADLRFASEADNQLRPQQFRLAVEIYGTDLAALKHAVGDNPAALAQFAVYLIEQKRIDDGLQIWNGLSEADKKSNDTSGNSILNSLIGVGRFHDAVALWNALAPSDAMKAEIGRMVDGSFEETISHSKEMVFGWQVATAPQMQIGIDPQKGHSGTRSLRLVFQVRQRLDSLQTTELVPVMPATNYEFECYVRTEKLQGGDTPFVQIVDAKDGTALASSSEAPNGDNDWTRIALSFKTGDKSEGIIVKLVHATCEADKICPLFGAVWYDDFSIKRRN